MRRRDLFGLSAGALSAGALAAGAAPLTWRALRAADAPRARLAMPPLLDTRNPGRLVMAAQAGQTSFRGGPPALTDRPPLGGPG